MTVEGQTLKDLWSPYIVVLFTYQITLSEVNPNMYTPRVVMQGNGFLSFFCVFLLIFILFELKNCLEEG